MSDVIHRRSLVEEDAAHLLRADRGGRVEGLKPRLARRIAADDPLAPDAFAALGDDLVKIFRAHFGSEQRSGFVSTVCKEPMTCLKV